MKPLEKLLEINQGSCTKAALMLGLRRQNIEGWRKTSRIPAHHATLVEENTGGVITRQDIWEESERVSKHNK